MNLRVVVTLVIDSSFAMSLAESGLQKLDNRYNAMLLRSVILRMLWRLATSFHIIESNNVDR